MVKYKNIEGSYMSKARKEVPKERTWDLTTFYLNQGKWEEEFKILQDIAEKGFFEIMKFKDPFPATALEMKCLLEEYFTLSRKIEKIYTYAHLCHDVDIAHTKNKEEYDKSFSLYQKFAHASSWIEPKILHLEKKVLEVFIYSESLQPYRFYLEKLQHQQKHILPESQEALLTLSMQIKRTPTNAFSALSNLDMAFDDIQDSKGNLNKLTKGLYAVYLKSEDRELRKNAFLGIHREYKKYNHTLAELVHGNTQGHLFTMRARNYPSCLKAALSPNNIPVSVYQNLIAAAHDALPTMHQYVALRKQKLGLEKIHFYDLQVPLVKEQHQKISFEKACEIVIEAVSPLGKEYQNIVRRALLEERWVDVEETKGKRSGAYSSGCFDSVPYMLLNYQGQLGDVLTLAHEVGHSLHSYYSNKTQDYHDASYPIFLAEIASTVNEALTYDYLLKRAKNSEERAYLLNQEIDSIRGTFFRQAMFAEFELLIHNAVEKDIPLSANFLNQTYRELNRKYFGDDIVLDEELDYEWSRVPHFYYNFYVYQYATGISAATKFFTQIHKEGTKKYLEFISSGGSAFPIDILKKAGIDMLSKDAFRDLIDSFSKLIESFKKEIE